MASPQNLHHRLSSGLYALLILLVLVALAVWLRSLLLGSAGEEMSFTELIRSWGHWGVIGSMGLMALHSFVPFPAEALAMANGMVYGLAWGTAITWSGAMIGALLAFGCARYFGQRFVQRMLGEKHWKKIEHWSHQHGWKTLLVVRFIPVIAFNLINYMAGLASVSLWTFVWTTALGILPLTLLSVWMGDQLIEQPLWVWGTLAIVLLISWYLLHFVSAKSAVGQTKSGDNE